MTTSLEGGPFYVTAEEVEKLVQEFDRCTLPRERWTHAAHLTVALLYILRYSWPHALELIRAGLQRYNAACGIITTAQSGYHETMTIFWMLMVRRYLSNLSASERSLVVIANNLIANYGSKHLPLEYYSRDTLMSPEARKRWVEPDLKAID